MKVADVEVIASSKIDTEHLGIFSNSMHLSNYEFSTKSHIKDEEDKKEDDQEKPDERTKRTKKTLDSI